MEKIFEIIVGFITFGYSQRGKKDRNIFNQMLAELSPDSEAITFLEEHDLGDPFLLEVISPLNRVSEKWHRVDRVFMNNKIERKKMIFLDKNEEFLRLLSERSAGQGGGFISIGVRDWEDRQEVLDYRRKLNKLATEAHDLYVDFYGYTNKKLPV